MKEAGIGILGHQTKSVFDLYACGREFDYVISACDEAHAERCPTFHGESIRLNWTVPDPSQFQGTELERVEKTRHIRDAIKEMITSLISELC